MFFFPFLLVLGRDLWLYMRCFWKWEWIGKDEDAWTDGREPERNVDVDVVEASLGVTVGCARAWYMRVGVCG